MVETAMSATQFSVRARGTSPGIGGGMGRRSQFADPADERIHPA